MKQNRLWSELQQDARYGVRLIARNRGFSIAAVLTLAVAIGGNTAIFSLVNALFLQPLAVRAPEQLVRIHTGESQASWSNVDEIRRRSGASFTGIIAQGQSVMSMQADPLPLRVMAGLVSTDYFSVLGTVPLVGRTLRADEERPDVAVLGERFWRTRFGATPAIVGQRITLDGRPYEIIGVMPRAFRGITPAGLTRDLWIPVDPRGTHLGLATDRAATRFEVFGRMQPDVSIEQADAAMRVLGAQLATEYPRENARFVATEVFAASGIGLYRGAGKSLLPVFMFVGFLTIIAGFVLFISCANLAGLLLGRAATRRQEIAVRLSLGASRGRLIRQLLTESLVLASLGGAAGLIVAALLASGLSGLATRFPVPIELNLALDLRVLTYTVGVSAACAMLFGLAPARRASRVPVVDALKIEGGSSGELARPRARQALIVAQVGISAVLLFWSGLFARSLLQAGGVDPGFDPTGVLLAEIKLADDAPNALQRADAAFVDLHNRVRALPSVEEAGWSTIVPLALQSNERFRIYQPDAPTNAANQGTWIVASRLSPGWFGTVRIPFVAGRDFTWQDREGAPLVAIVNETLARQRWNGAALGQQFKYAERIVTVVGIVRDTKYWTLGEAISPAVYLPFRQALAPYPVTLHVRTSNPRATAASIRQAVQNLLPDTPVTLTPMAEAVAVAIVPARVGALVTGAFGLLGALLATMGVYGLIAYVVAQRSRELAIRRAIGAPTRHILRVVVGSSTVLATIGLLLGLAAGSLTAPLLGGLLVNVSPRDPLAMLMAACVILGTAFAACTVPALRAVRINPIASLKAL